MRRTARIVRRVLVLRNDALKAELASVLEHERAILLLTASRRDPFARDVLLDPGGTAMPRMTALHMLRSTISTVSAPANSSFRGSITHPTQPLCTLRVRRRRRLTQHSLPGGLLGLTWAGLTPAERASFARAFVHSITSSARRRSVGGIVIPIALAVFRFTA